jgi:hypothetical protein
MRTLVMAGLVVTLAAGTADVAGAQPATRIEVPAAGVTQEIILSDGTRAYGRVEQVAEGRVRFRTVDGAMLEVDATQVSHLSPADGRVVRGDYWRADPNPTRLFFGPTGRSLRRGDTYMGVYEVVLPFVQVGVTDRFSAGGGTPLMFGDGGSHPFWLTPKMQVIDTGSTGVAIGVMHMLADGEQLGIAYGVVTQGSTDSAVTVGAGYGYATLDDDGGGGPVLMLGGEHRVHRGLKVVSENYAFQGGGILSAGVRFLGERLSADLGLAVPLGAGEAFVFPVVNFVWKFR